MDNLLFTRFVTHMIYEKIIDSKKYIIGQRIVLTFLNRLRAPRRRPEGREDAPKAPDARRVAGMAHRGRRQGSLGSGCLRSVCRRTLPRPATPGAGPFLTRAASRRA